MQIGLPVQVKPVALNLLHVGKVVSKSIVLKAFLYLLGKLVTGNAEFQKPMSHGIRYRILYLLANLLLGFIGMS